MIHLDLSPKEIRLLVQSLAHCLDTCQHKNRDEPCEDCDSAARLRQRLELSMKDTP